MDLDYSRKKKKMECTLQSIGLYSSTSIATSILLENVHDSNLVSDISSIPYLEGNLGETDLEPLEGLPPFVDDMYVFGFCRKEEIVCRGRSVSFDPETKAAGNMVRHIFALFLDAIPGKKKFDIAIQCTMRTDAKGSMRKTIEAIERTTNSKTRRKWLEMHAPEEEYVEKLEKQHAIAALFVAKVDLSEHTLEEVVGMLPALQILLDANAYGIYSIDYTQDFSGTLDRPKLVEHLESIGCVEQGTFGDALDSRRATILDNTKSVGNHVCTWVYSYEGHTVREKMYNKIVCQFEAGGVQQNFGGHLAEFVACPNRHLRKTLEHPASKERGITRLEISIYGCSREDPLEFVEEIRRQTISDMEGKKMFRIQTAANHWKNFSNAIDRCCLFVDHPKRTILVCWYGHSATGKLGGIRVPIGKKDIEKVARACIADFGFHTCPIFRIDLEECTRKNLVFSKLRCYTKDADSKTILCPTKAPTKRYLGEQDPSNVLFPNKHIHFQWREKSTRIGMGKLSTNIEEIETTRKISLLRKRERRVLLDSIATEEEERKWIQEKREQTNILVAKRREEVEAVAEILEQRERIAKIQKECSLAILDALSGNVAKVCDLQDLPRTFSVLGFRQTSRSMYTSGKIYILQYKEGDPIAVWATKRLDKILHNQKSVQCEKGDASTHAYIDRGEGKIELEIEPKIPWMHGFYSPIHVVEIPNPKDVLLRDEGAPKFAILANPPTIQLAFRETTTPAERRAKLADFAEGEYPCYEYSTFLFRKKERYVLFLGEEGRPAVGYWIDERMRELSGIPNAPMLCRIGKIGTTKNGKKERRIAFSVGEQEEI